MKLPNLAKRPRHSWRKDREGEKGGEHWQVVEKPREAFSIHTRAVGGTSRGRLVLRQETGLSATCSGVRGGLNDPPQARIMHEPPAASADMAVLPGVLGSRTLRRTEKYASGPSSCGCPVARPSPRSPHGVSCIMRVNPVPAGGGERESPPGWRPCQSEASPVDRYRCPPLQPEASRTRGRECSPGP